MERNTGFTATPWRFTALKPARHRATTATPDSAAMSTFQHTTQPVHRTRLMLAVLFAGAACVLTIALIAAGGSSTPSLPTVHPTKAELTRQLESVNSARFGTARPNARTQALETSQQQLQSVAGARYHVRVASR